MILCEVLEVGSWKGRNILLPTACSPDMISVVKKAEELLCAIQEVCAGYESIGLSASIGVSVYPNQGTTLEELYAKADDALYRAKRKGKNRYIFAE